MLTKLLYGVHTAVAVKSKKLIYFGITMFCNDFSHVHDMVGCFVDAYELAFKCNAAGRDKLCLYNFCILKFNADKQNDRIEALNGEIAQIRHNIEHIVAFTIKWYEHLKEKYGEGYPRRTVIRGFDSIEAAKVAEANKRLYIDRDGGFIGTSLKEHEFVCNCSDIDDLIIFYKDGKYKMVKVQEKLYIGKNVLYINIFKRGDSRTIYNVVYLNGKGGAYYKKRFAVTGLTRDKEYDLTKGAAGSKIVWFSANPNGEAEVLRITLKPKHRLKVLQFDLNFAELDIKGKDALGNLVTKNEIHRITLKEKGTSTLGGRKVWFDHDVLRLNYDGRGDYLGEFHANDQVLIIHDNGEYYTSSFAETNHYDDGIRLIRKFDANTIWTVALNDASLGFPYLKRFKFEASAKRQRFIGEDAKSQIILMTDVAFPRLEVKFGGADEVRGSIEIDAEEFIGVKSFKAKGKRISTYEIASITELEPTRFPEETESETAVAEIDGDIAIESNDEISQIDVRDELTGQQQLFTDDDSNE